MPMGRSVGVLQPEVVEEELGLGAGVVEDQRGAVAASPRPGSRGWRSGRRRRPRAAGRRFPAWRCRGRGRGRPCRMAQGPGGGPGSGRGRAGLRPWPRGRRGAGRGQAIAGGTRQQHQLVAALAFGQRVDLVDDHPLQAREDARRVFVAEQQGEAFGRGQQDMRRVGALAAALGVGGVAGAVLDPDRQARAFDRGAQVAADVGGQRLERRDVEGVEALVRVRPPVRPGWAGTRPASCRRRWARSAGWRGRPRAPACPAGAGAASSPWRRTSRRGVGEAWPWAQR